MKERDVALQVEIREADPSDAEAVSGLLAGLGYPDDVRAVRDRITSFAASANDHVLVADVDTQPVGVLALSLTPRFAESGMFSRITALAVAPSAQGQGVGRRLVAEAEQIAVGSGSTLMQVNSGRRSERDRAHEFYVSLGYRDQHVHHVLYDKALSPTTGK